MRKIFATLALTLCLTAMVSCDGDKQADNSTKRTEQSRTGVSNATIKNKAESLVRRAAEATMKGDYNEYQRIIQEEQEFAGKLTDAQIEYYNQCAMEYADRIMH